MPTRRAIGSSGMKLGIQKLRQQQAEEIQGIGPYDVLRIGPYGLLRIGPYGVLRIGPYGVLRIGPYGVLRNPISQRYLDSIMPSGFP
jgi:hypothetical protein